MDPRDLRRWARRQSPRESEEDLPPPQPLAPQQSPPPPGMAWAYSPAHGYVLVPLAMEAPPRQPGGYMPPAPVRAPAPAGYPEGFLGGVAPPGGGNVIPFRPRTCVLVRQGNKDPYADFLAGVPDIAPNSNFAHLAEGLSPDEGQLEGLPEMMPMAAANPNVRVNQDPAMDAFGSRGAPSG